MEELLEDVEGELAEVEKGVENGNIALYMVLGGIFFLLVIIAFGSICWWIRLVIKARIFLDGAWGKFFSLGHYHTPFS